MNYFQILFELQGVSQALLDDIHHSPIHVNFQIRSRYIFKPIIHRKKQWIVLRDLRSFFKRMLFMIPFMHVVSDYYFFSILWRSGPIFQVSLSAFINYFCHVKFYTRSSFIVYVMDFLLAVFLFKYFKCLEELIDFLPKQKELFSGVIFKTRILCLLSNFLLYEVCHK